MNRIKDKLMKLNFEQKIINAILLSGVTLSLLGLFIIEVFGETRQDLRLILLTKMVLSF